MRAFVLFLLVAAPAARADSASPAESLDACQRDEDCTISAFAGCCEWCPSPSKAWSKRALKKQEDICAIVDCAPPREPKGGCPKMPRDTKKVAQCVHQACVAH